MVLGSRSGAASSSSRSRFLRNRTSTCGRLVPPIGRWALGPSDGPRTPPRPSKTPRPRASRHEAGRDAAANGIGARRCQVGLGDDRDPAVRPMTNIDPGRPGPRRDPMPMPFATDHDPAQTSQVPSLPSRMRLAIRIRPPSRLPGSDQQPDPERPGVEHRGEASRPSTVPVPEIDTTTTGQHVWRHASCGGSGSRHAGRRLSSPRSPESARTL